MKNIYLSSLSPGFSPKALISVDRNGFWHVGSILVSIGNTCVWHWAWWVKLSELHALSSIICPTQHCMGTLQHSSGFCSLCKAFSTSVLPLHPHPHPTLPTRVRNLFFSGNVFSQMNSHKYPPASQTGVFLPSLCLLSFSCSSPPTPDPTSEDL